MWGSQMQVTLRKWVTKSQELFKPCDWATAGAGKRIPSLESSFQDAGAAFSLLRGATVAFCSMFSTQSCSLCLRGLSASSPPSKNFKLASEWLRGWKVVSFCVTVQQTVNLPSVQLHRALGSIVLPRFVYTLCCTASVFFSVYFLPKQVTSTGAVHTHWLWDN